jgi:glutathione S-transferase
MMVMYSGRPLICENYDIIVREDGTFSASAWFSVKDGFRDRNPLINLPYVVDGDNVITQSNACFLYLGRKLSLLGSSEKDLSSCEQLLCEVMDVRNKIVDRAYGAPDSSHSAWLESVTARNGSLWKLNQWLLRKGDSAFFVGHSATAPDFHIWEVCDQLRNMATYFKLEDPLLDLPQLADFHGLFRGLPKNAKYFESQLAFLPANNLSAKTYGATPSGAPFNPDSAAGSHTRPWIGSSGSY